MLTEATAAHDILERRMADAEAALGAANERLSRERLVAAEQATERQTEFQAQLEREVEERRSVEELLARAETARNDAEKRHAAAMTIAATRWPSARHSSRPSCRKALRLAMTSSSS